MNQPGNGTRADNEYPPAKFIPDNYADATFSNGINLSITTPPTLVSGFTTVPEFPYGAAAALGLSLGAGYALLRRNMKRRQSLQVIGCFSCLFSSSLLAFP
jgi:hypothetical protein